MRVIWEFQPSTPCEINIFGALGDTIVCGLMAKSNGCRNVKWARATTYFEIYSIFFKVFEVNVIVLGHMLIKKN